MGVKLLAVAFVCVASAAGAASPYVCGGFAQLGGAQLLCSHVDPKAPPQFCTFSWALQTTAGPPSVAEGSFLLVPGTANATVYQGAGYAAALSPPIVLCQARRSR